VKITGLKDWNGGGEELACLWQEQSFEE